MKAVGLMNALSCIDSVVFSGCTTHHGVVNSGSVTTRFIYRRALYARLSHNNNHNMMNKAYS